jgi:hypothetical protein
MAVHLITLDDMLDEFGRRVGEPVITDTRWEEPVRTQWLNLGQSEVCEYTRCLEEDWTSSVGIWASSGNEVVTLPNNCYPDGIIAIWWVDSSDNMTRLTVKHQKFENIKNTDTGTPSKIFQVGDNLHLMPLPDAAGTVRIHGERMPDELSDGTDQSLIPAPYRDLPVMYAVIQAWKDDGELSKADREERAYWIKMKRLRAVAQGLESRRYAVPRNRTSRRHEYQVERDGHPRTQGRHRDQEYERRL